jgi:hypothetical protein
MKLPKTIAKTKIKDKVQTAEGWRRSNLKVKIAKKTAKTTKKAAK